MRKTIVDETEGMRAVFSERLRETYKSKGLTQKDAADELNIPEATFRSYVCAGRMPQPEMLYKIRTVWGVTIDWLLGGPDDYKNALDITSTIERVCNEVIKVVLDSLSLMWGKKMPDMDRLRHKACAACLNLLRLYTGPQSHPMEMLMRHQQALEEVRKSLK